MGLNFPFLARNHAGKSKLVEIKKRSIDYNVFLFLSKPRSDGVQVPLPLLSNNVTKHQLWGFDAIIRGRDRTWATPPAVPDI